MRVSQTIGPLVGGVSQAPSSVRSPEFATELINALAHPTLGNTKRPGSKHLAKLANSTDSHYPSATLFPFNAGDKRRYILSISAGIMRVVEEDTGVERTVSMAPGAIDYISGLLDEERPFDAAVTGGTLYLVNRARVVKMAGNESAARAPEAVVAIRAADYGTSYTITVNGNDATYRTPEGSSANVRSEISTDVIAANLALAVKVTPGGSALTVTRSGSALYIKRTDGGNFTISVGDGLADQGMTLVFGTLSSAIDLPPTGVVDGFTVRIVGDPTKDGDDFWMTWKGGVWQECARPGSLTSLDPSTMPHVLTLGGALHDGLTVPDAPATPGVEYESDMSIPLSWDAPGRSVYSAGSLSMQSNSTADANIVPANGSSASVEVRYDLDTSALTSSQTATVELRRVSGGVETVLDSRDFPYSATPFTNRTLSGTDSFSAGDSARLALTVTDSGDPVEDRPTPLDSTGIARLVVAPTGPESGNSAGIRYIPNADASLVVLPPDAPYPASAVIVVASGGQSASYTVPGVGATGAQIATAIAAAWPSGSVSCTITGPGKLAFSSGSTPPVMTATCTFDPASKLWVPGQNLTPGTLTGSRIVNLTTGAEATITSNTAATISFGPLTGGSATIMRRGDLVRVAVAVDSFSFAQGVWEDRIAGDDASNPPPSFVNKTISGIAITQNRLIVADGENIVASGAGKLGRFFRTTTQQVLDSDMIDVRGTASRGLPFWYMVEWNDTLHLFNGRSLFALRGDPLTPRTVGLGHVYELSTDEACKPVVVGRRLYVARVKNGYTQLLALEAVGQGVGVDSYDTTQDIPEYLVGSPVAMAADADSPLVLVTELGNTRYVYSMVPIQQGRDTVFAWSRWTLDANAKPLAVSMEGGDLVMVLARPDGVYLESIDTLAPIT